MTDKFELPDLPEQIFTAAQMHEYATLAVKMASLEQKAAVRTLKAMDYTYTEGAELWQPPIGKTPKWLEDDSITTPERVNKELHGNA